MKRAAVIISILSILVVILSFSTKIINAPTVAETQAASYNDITIIAYLVMGVLMILVALISSKLHIFAAILPLGLGIAAFSYALWVAYCKGLLII